VRVVADTNVLLSAFLFGGLPGEFLDLALLRSFELVISPALLDELDEKLCGKFRIDPEKSEAIRLRLQSLADVVQPQIVLNVVKSDPDDDRVLECAVAGRADYIVSGDKHLRGLGSYGGIEIVTVRQFMDMIQV
jgi:putative PIN family toxin of toxin-antitoxin system